MRTFIAAFLVLLLGMAGRADALTVAFSFDDEPSADMNGRAHIGGTVTGLLFGLQDNTANQIPTAFQITSDVSGFGMTQTYYDSFVLTFGSGITLSSGTVTDADLLFNFQDPGATLYQIAFNSSGASNQNRLIWNGGVTPVVGIGNDDGFAGATYSAAVTPIPAALPLFASALSGLGYLGWRRRKSAQAATA
jgi:hypothetical protein